MHRCQSGSVLVRRLWLLRGILVLRPAHGATFRITPIPARLTVTTGRAGLRAASLLAQAPGITGAGTGTRDGAGEAIAHGTGAAGMVDMPVDARSTAAMGGAVV